MVAAAPRRSYDSRRQTPTSGRSRVTSRTERQIEAAAANAPREPFGPAALLLVGATSTGKSTLLSRLVGWHLRRIRAPGSSLELAWDRLEAGPFRQVIDAPGCSSLAERSEDANLVRELIVGGQVGGALLVLDAKDPRRGLALALELAELGLPLAIALNMTDEAPQRGVEVDAERLSELLGVPVAPTVATEGAGLRRLKRAVSEARPPSCGVDYPKLLSPAVEALAALPQALPGGTRAATYLLLADVPGVAERVRTQLGPDIAERVDDILRAAAPSPQQPTDIVLARALGGQTERLAAAVTRHRPTRRTAWSDRVGVWTRRPATGFPIALAVLALLYLFVGWFGADVMVKLLEGELFNQWLVPLIKGWLEGAPELVREGLVGEFGVIPVGIGLALGLVLPVLATFFFFLALLEDSGYLPRLSLLLDRGLRKVGLTGKGVVPVVMAFSCVTMAVITARVLETRKQRIIATLLVVLAVPCAPLLGVMMIVLGQLSPWATVLTFGILLSQFVFVGWLANKILPRRGQDLLLELPPIRAPRLGNVGVKTGRRLWWFLREAIPFFLLGALLLFVLDRVEALEGLRQAVRPVLVEVLGLPAESAYVFLFTLIRREAGAALLVTQLGDGLYDGVQALVTLVVMTLMIPCINTVLVTFKERGWRAATAILSFSFFYSLIFGALLMGTLRLTGVTL